MTRKRNNPSKIELLGKIPDPSIAKIFRTSTYQIKKERETRGIPTSSVRSKKKIKEVLQSLNAPREYFSLLGLADLTPRQKLHKERAEQREKKKREEKKKWEEIQKKWDRAAREEKKMRERAKQEEKKKWEREEREKRVKRALLKEIYLSKQNELRKAREQRARELAAEEWQIFTGHPVNIDDFFEPESEFDRKRRLAIENDTSNFNDLFQPRRKNPRSLFSGIDQLLGAQVDQFQEDLLHNPLSAYFKFLGFAVGATTFSILTVKAVSSLLDKSK